MRARRRRPVTSTVEVTPTCGARLWLPWWTTSCRSPRFPFIWSVELAYLVPGDSRYEIADRRRGWAWSQRRAEAAVRDATELLVAKGRRYAAAIRPPA